MKQKKKIILILLLILLLITSTFSSIKIIIWCKDNKKTNNMIKTIKESTRKIEKEEDDKTEKFCNRECISNKFLEVDFKNLKKKNEETVGWIQVENTNIDYPIVQHSNNDYYLNHSFDKSYNDSGWVFADYRNNFSLLDRNTIIYAHGRVDGTMFGTLKNLLNQDYFNENKKVVVKLSTESANYLLEAFSIYHIRTTDDYSYINFSQSDYEKFLKKIINRSSYHFGITVGKEDKILTLSTCYNVHEKVVLHARVVKRQERI